MAKHMKEKDRDLKDWQKMILARFEVFREYNINGFNSALQTLEEQNINKRSKIGLNAELLFYDMHIDELSLSVNSDAGDKCDFVGIYGGEKAHFDVTTSLEHKKLSDYEPFQQRGNKYYISLYDPKEKCFEITDINFPFCDICGEGRLFPIVVVEEDRSSSAHNLVNLYEACSFDGADSKLVSSKPAYCSTPSEIISEVKDFYDDFNSDPTLSKEEIKRYTERLDQEIDEELRRYVESIRRYVKNEVGRLAFLVGGWKFQMTDSDGDGFWYLSSYWTHPLLEDSYDPECFEEVW